MSGNNLDVHGKSGIKIKGRARGITGGGHLKRFGFAVVTASSGLQALELLGQREFDLVISDLLMPGMDGITLLRKMRKSSVNIPFIVMTACGSIETAVAAMSQEAVERLLGRLLTDDSFRKRAEKSIASLCREAGYDLNENELGAISHDDLVRLDMVSHQLDRNIKRSGQLKRDR